MGSLTSKNQALISTLLFLFLVLVNFARSDLNQDKAECSDKLVGLANCLPYVAGESKTPTIDCCSGLKEVIDKSKRCLCILIKDRDDPNLGLKINVTLALQLPNACHTPTNITQCVDILHLKPNSPEAKVFEGFEKVVGNNSSTATTPAPATASNASGSSGNGTSTGAKNKSDGGWGKNLLAAETLSGILPISIFMSQFFFLL